MITITIFGVRPIPLLPQGYVEDPGHSTESAVGRLHPNTHTPLTQRSRSGPTMPLSGHSVGTYPETSSHATLSGNTRPQSSHLAEPLSTGPGLKSGISVHKLVATTKKKKKAQAGNQRSNILLRSSQAREKPPPIIIIILLIPDVIKPLRTMAAGSAFSNKLFISLLV